MIQQRGWRAGATMYYCHVCFTPTSHTCARDQRWSHRMLEPCQRGWILSLTLLATISRPVPARLRSFSQPAPTEPRRPPPERGGRLRGVRHTLAWPPSHCAPPSWHWAWPARPVSTHPPSPLSPLLPSLAAPSLPPFLLSILLREQRESPGLDFSTSIMCEATAPPSPCAATGTSWLHND